MYEGRKHLQNLANLTKNGRFSLISSFAATKRMTENLIMVDRFGIFQDALDSHRRRIVEIVLWSERLYYL